jgi:predicted nucleic acid-binding protein
VKAVVDASVAVKWYLRSVSKEENTELALQILEAAAFGNITLYQPPHFVAEMSAVLARLNPSEALLCLQDLMDLDFQRVEKPEIYATATELAMQLKQHVFDALYHAVALHTPDTILITADQRYYDKAKEVGQIVLLEDWTPDQSTL